MTLESTPAPSASPPKRPLPAGACDAHSHVFGPFDRFPTSRPPTYALPLADAAAHAEVRARLGIDRGVIVQPTPYGHDPAALLDAIAGSSGALRGVAVADADVSDSTLADWRTAGVRGLRFTEMMVPGGGRYPGSVGFAALRALGPRMREIGLHAQIWADAPELARWLPELGRLGIPLVIDHMGMPNAALGADDPAFLAIIEAMKDGRAWVKLSVCRVGGGSAYADVRPLHDALVEAAPDRVLWGSDWPYVRMAPAPDAGHLLDLFDRWIDDDDLRRRILVANPEALYGFEAKGKAA